MKKCELQCRISTTPRCQVSDYPLKQYVMLTVSYSVDVASVGNRRHFVCFGDGPGHYLSVSKSFGSCSSIVYPVSTQAIASLNLCAHPPIFLNVRLFAYPLGKFLAWLMPLKTYRFPKRLGGATLELNPGPFNIKENTLIVMMANASLLISPALHAATVPGQYMDLHIHTG
jgi:hypothetical protein